MALMTYQQALRLAMTEEMERDPNVFICGEEVGQYQGTYQVTRGMLEKFGPERVVDTPISEIGIAGLATGAAMVGLRPIAEFMTWSFALEAMDQLINHAAKITYMSGGRIQCPVVFRGPAGVGTQLSAQHSQSLESWYAHVPGLKVVLPSTPSDAKGLLKTAIREDNPIIFMEHAGLYGLKGEVSEDPEFLVPFGKAAIQRAGTDITLISYSRGVHLCLKAAEKLADEGVEQELGAFGAAVADHGLHRFEPVGGFLGIGIVRQPTLASQHVGTDQHRRETSWGRVRAGELRRGWIDFSLR